MAMREKLAMLWKEYGTQALIVLFGLAAFIMVTTGVLSAPHALEGKQAPPFELPLLDGGDLNLSGHLGKDVIVLDFWAVWCPPCRKGLPVIAEIAETYADRGVAVYAVNLGDDPKQIQAFLRESGISVPVALDMLGHASELYQVQSIPQTVIIGRDGDVEQVHVGIPSGFKRSLAQTLDALLTQAAVPAAES